MLIDIHRIEMTHDSCWWQPISTNLMALSIILGHLFEIAFILVAKLWDTCSRNLKLSNWNRHIYFKYSSNLLTTKSINPLLNATIVIICVLIDKRITWKSQQFSQLTTACGLIFLSYQVMKWHVEKLILKLSFEWLGLVGRIFDIWWMIDSYQLVIPKDKLE